MPLIEVKDVTKRYHKGDETITPLDAVSLNVEQGEFLSLMGASGTGKSTLLNLIASIDRPDSGSICVDIINNIINNIIRYTWIILIVALSSF